MVARLQPSEEEAADRQRKAPKPWSVDSGNEASSEDSNDSVHPETTKSALTGQWERITDNERSYRLCRLVEKSMFSLTTLCSVPIDKFLMINYGLLYQVRYSWQTPN